MTTNRLQHFFTQRDNIPLEQMEYQEITMNCPGIFLAKMT